MPKKAKASLLPQAIRDDLIAERDRIQAMLGQLDQAEACGVDCQSYRERGQRLLTELEALIANAFSDQPPATGG